MDTQRAAMMAIDLMAYHGLMKDDPLGYSNSWNFEFNRATTYLGLCNYQKRTIFLSKPLTELNTEDTMLNTICHEIAHALAQYKDAHNDVWKLIAVEVGARPEACSSFDIVRAQTPYQATCLDCNEKIYRTRRPSYGIRYGYHRSCRHKENGGKLAWTYNGVEY